MIFLALSGLFMWAVIVAATAYLCYDEIRVRRIYAREKLRRDAIDAAISRQ